VATGLVRSWLRCCGSRQQPRADLFCLFPGIGRVLDGVRGRVMNPMRGRLASSALQRRAGGRGALAAIATATPNPRRNVSWHFVCAGVGRDRVKRRRGGGDERAGAGGGAPADRAVTAPLGLIGVFAFLWAGPGNHCIRVAQHDEVRNEEVRPRSP